MPHGASNPASSGRKIVLVIGETGSGKSTLINYLTNYFKGGNIAAPRIAIPTEYYSKPTEAYQYHEANVSNQTASQTEKCMDYDFESGTASYRFIDTPGMSDSRGVERDEKNIQQILQAAQSAGTLSAIVIVINGTQCRGTINLRNTLTRLRGITPNALTDNLIVVLTSCDSTNFKFKLMSLHPWTLKAENIFAMNNAALSQDPLLMLEGDHRQVMEALWKKSMAEINRFVLSSRENVQVRTLVVQWF
ncbi:uncharacterized protein LOC129600966 [Paramacrobiotus metropolitanus]|uniref:uncharacterized protein LOC129600966 n=1 Tax=Paramacrobiotus metropolitanus TaxID=2943436 RepID=UPI0024456AC1|nr:uncharacterized protein LOC129600966 [Paramacrobiotus metropolitanus]